jgi:hypothetical protein
VSVRDSATVTVVRPVDGTGRKPRRRAGRRDADRGESYRIHTDVLRAALALADGDPNRLDWRGAAVVHGVITMIRVRNS